MPCTQYLAVFGDRAVNLDVPTGRYGMLTLPDPTATADPTSLWTDRAAAEHKLISRPRETGGMTDSGWWPHMSALLDTDASGSSVAAVGHALRRIRRSARRLRRGFAPLIGTLGKAHRRMRPRTVDGDTTDIADSVALQTLTELLQAHLHARVWYPHKIECLVGSAALAMNAWQRGIAVNFIIGVQTDPFYAHAWVTHRDTAAGDVVVNDGPDCARKLAPVLSIP